MSKKVPTKIRLRYKFNPYKEDQREIEWRLTNVKRAGSYRKYNLDFMIKLQAS